MRPPDGSGWPRGGQGRRAQNKAIDPTRQAILRQAAVKGRVWPSEPAAELAEEPVFGGLDLDSDTRYLCQVADAFRLSGSSAVTRRAGTTVAPQHKSPDW